MQRLLLFLLFSGSILQLTAEDGYDLWLRYVPIENESYARECVKLVSNVYIPGESATIDIIKDELQDGIGGLLQKDICINNTPRKKNHLIIATTNELDSIQYLSIRSKISSLENDGYIIQTDQLKNRLLITSKSDLGLLYGTFHLLRLMQTQQDLSHLDLLENPKTTHRLLNHWDNLDRTVERGYAGFSIWDWHKLPDYIDQGY
ncbi:MAG: alpha-glucuronidase family glycosyl hydrolase, partial [Bacteroidales bacterium]|nr:alpha-glucuronidase family glycosyl hydrolase [Bacteroidales bacterium]